MLGSISLERINHINRSATLGIFIGDKDFRSKGYGTEALKKVLDFLFNEVGFELIYARHIIDNVWINAEIFHEKDMILQVLQLGHLSKIMLINYICFYHKTFIDFF